MLVVLLDDNVIIRDVFRTMIKRVGAKLGKEINMYSSDNGVEGLGYVYITNPEVVIIDSTLPKYSGMELVDFLSLNEKLTSNNRLVIVLHENEKNIAERPSNFLLINKNGKQVLDQVEKAICLKFGGKCEESRGSRSIFGFLKDRIEKTLFTAAHRKDRLFKRVDNFNPIVKLPLFFIWLFLEFYIAFFLAIKRLLSSRAKDSNIQMEAVDLKRFRVRYYPTMLTVFVSLIMLFFQLSLFMFGSLVVMNIRVVSIFAAGGGTEILEYDETTKEDFEYSEEQVNFSEDGVSLKLIEVQDSDPLEYEYNTEGESVITSTAGIDYTNLVRMTEESSIIDTEENEVLESVESSVKYQISNDGNMWYYSSEGEWLEAGLTSVEANTASDLNTNLPVFSEQIGSGSFYVRAFLSSADSNYSPRLTSVTVEFEQEVVTPIVEPQADNFVSPNAPDPNLTEFYVDGVGGNDSNTGTAAFPLKTIQVAITAAGNGSGNPDPATIYLKGGITYTGTEVCIPGGAVVVCIMDATFLPDLTIKSWPGTGVPTIDVNNQNAGIAALLMSKLTIEGIKFTDVPSGSYAIDTLLVDDITITNNIFDGEGSVRTEDSHDLIARNNTFYNTQDVKTLVLDQNGRLYLENNVFLSDAPTTTQIMSCESYFPDGKPSISMDGNLMDNTELGLICCPLYNPAIHLIPGSCTYRDYNVYGDANLANPSVGDFTQLSGSDTINTGKDLSSSVTEDILGYPRPGGDAYDSGAYELPPGDGNPIIQGDGSYIITVDTTTDEDNVSSTGLDDGDGAYSGGGLTGPDGAANGNTSFREAVTVANLHSGPDKIHFNIPTSDSGWNTTQFPGAFRLLQSKGSRILITGNDTYIDGSTQTSFTGNTKVAVTEPDTMPVSGNATTGPEIILDYVGYAGTASPVKISGNDSTIKGIGFYNLPIGKQRPIVLSGNGNSLVSSDVIGNGQGGVSVTGSNVMITDNVIRNNTPNYYVYDGIETVKSGTIQNNQIVSNGSMGIYLAGSSSSSDSITVRGNLIKANGSNTASVKVGGIVLRNFDGGASKSNIAITENTIVGNAEYGILVSENMSKAHISENVIYGNGGSQIDITKLATHVEGDGITQNDSGDYDSGPNELMNHPVINRVSYLGGGRYRLEGDIDDRASEEPIAIEVCESDIVTGRLGSCLRSLGTTTASSPWETVVTISGDNGYNNRVFSSLATNKNGSTSEFGANFDTSTDDDYIILDYLLDLVYPIGGEGIEDRTPNFEWENLEDPSIKTWELYIGESEETLELTAEIDNTELINQYALPLEDILSRGRTYYWKMIGVRDPGIAPILSPVETFEVLGENTDNAIDLTYPIGGQNIEDRTPTFSWIWDKESREAEGEDAITDGFYRLYLKHESENIFNFFTEIEGLSENAEFTPTENLKIGTYTWRVEAVGQDDELLEKSIEETFTVFVSEEVDGSILEEQEGGFTSTVGEDVLLTSGLIVGGVGLSTSILLIASGAGLGLIDAGRQAFGLILGTVMNKKRKKWGVVVDIITGKRVPFAVIRLYDEAGKQVNQTVSDTKGEYGFVASADGKYSLEVKADNYKTVKKDIKLKSESELIEDIELERPDTFRDKNSLELLLKRLDRQTVIKIMNVSIFLLMIAGFLYTLTAFWKSPSVINVVFILLYALLFIANALFFLWVFTSKKKKVGKIVENVTKEPLVGARVRFYKGEIQKSIEVSEVKGILRTKLRPGTYDVLVSKSGYANKETRVEINKRGYLSHSIRLDPLG